MAVRVLGDWRSSLLVCDDCDAVMDREGRPSQKPHSASSPDDLAPHYMPCSDVSLTARDCGWSEEEDGRWSCPPCSSRRFPKG
ncbi:hypothetical protein BH11MYX4_BH11MYX4_14270 [soil metagenome]